MSLVCHACCKTVPRLSSRQNVFCFPSGRAGTVFDRNGTKQNRSFHRYRPQCQSEYAGTAFHSPNSTKDYKRVSSRVAWISSTSSVNRSAEESAKKFQRPIAQTTIDEEEVSKFSKLAELWWDEAGEFEALHSMNELRVPLVRDALVSHLHQHFGKESYRPSLPLDGFQILDVGSGGGILAEPLARLGAFVIGVDASEENIKIAQAHVIHEPKVARNIKYIQATVEDLVGTEAEKFDAVIASEVVEHVAEVSTFVTACCQLVKPGGSIFFTTLNKTYLSYTLGVLGAENLLRLVSPGTHDWNKFISPQDLQYILDQNQFSTRLLHGMMYNPMTKRWSWIKNTSVNYAIHAVRALESPLSSTQRD